MTTGPFRLISQSLTFATLVFVGLAGFQRAHAADVPLIVDFRDGTVLRISLPDDQLPWRRISDDGQVTQDPRQLSNVNQLRFVLTPATEKVAHVRRLIARLGADGFHDREEAQAELLQNAARFRKILELTLPRSTDFEVRWRIKQIIKIFDDSNEEGGLLSNDYDLMTLKGSEDEIHGDVGDWSVKAKYRGSEVLIDRANVLAVRNAPLDLDLSAEPPVVHMDRIPRDDDGAFPRDVTRVDFDRGPKGEVLAAGTDISETYVASGCVFSTSFDDSYVAIEPYNVGGRSGGRCAATHKPLYQGTITVKFCKPGNAQLPAGVRYVGFWTSHIAPDGTALQAFDARGRKIAEIKTIRSQRDYLALTTNVPIAYIKIVPDEEVDPDYAIDDLVFDTPKPLSEAGDPDRYSVMLTTGERLHGTALDTDGKMVTLKNLTIGVEELKVPADEIAVLVPPRTPIPIVEDGKRCFIRLTDGSVLRAAGDKGLKLDRFPKLPIDANRLVALWGAETMLQEPADDSWPEQGSLAIFKNEDPVAIEEWKLGEAWIESKSLTERTDYSYANSPIFWFRKPAKRPKGSGLLRTVSGEEIVLTDGDGFKLKSWSLKGVTVTHGNSEWTLGLGQVRSLLLPKIAE